jgi:MFS family permease
MRDFTAFEAGLALLPGALITGLMSPITGRIFDKFGARKLVMVGLTIITVSSFAFTRLDTSTSLVFMTIMYSVRMFGLSMVMMPIATAGLNQLPKRLIPHGAAMDNTMRQIAASVGTAILVTVMTTSEGRAERIEIANPAIHGANVAFIVVSVLSLVGLIISYFVRDTKLTEEELEKRDLERRKEKVYL